MMNGYVEKKLEGGWGEGAAPPHMAQLGSNIAPRSIQPQHGVMIAAGKGNEVLAKAMGSSRSQI